MAVLSIPDTGNQATIDANFRAPLTVSIDAITIGQTPIDISTLATTKFKSNRPTDLREPVKVKCSYMFIDASDAWVYTEMIPTSEPYSGTTYTVRFPGAGSLAGTAFVESVEMPSLKNGEVMMGSMTICFDGFTGPTFTVAP